MGILNELEKFRHDLIEYRKLINYLRNNTITKKGRDDLDALYKTIVPDAGRYKNLIIELSGMHNIPIPVKDREISTDIWAVSFQIPTVIRTPVALGYCITAVGQAIGKLNDDIKDGLRDEKGNLTDYNNINKDKKELVFPPNDNLKSLFQNLKFHPKIVEVSHQLFFDGHYAQAILEAFKAVEENVRDKSGIKDKYGKQLMAEVFNEINPIIKVLEAGEFDKDVQEGFKFLFMGSSVGIRNPKAHHNVIQKDPYITLEYLGLASLLLKRIDGFWMIKKE